MVALVVKDAAEVCTPSNDEVYLELVAGPRVFPRHFCSSLHLEVAAGDAEAMVTAELEQPLPVLIHPVNAKVVQAGRPCLPVSPNMRIEIT